MEKSKPSDNSKVRFGAFGEMSSKSSEQEERHSDQKLVLQIRALLEALIHIQRFMVWEMMILSQKTRMHICLSWVGQCVRQKESAGARILCKPPGVWQLVRQSLQQGLLKIKNRGQPENQSEQTIMLVRQRIRDKNNYILLKFKA